MILRSMISILTITVVFETGKCLEYVQLGGIFDIGDELEQLAFELATSITKRNNESTFYIQPISERLDIFNVLNVSQRMCELFTDGVAGVFKPSSANAFNYVLSLYSQSARNNNQENGNIVLSFYPPTVLLAKLYDDIVDECKWRRFAILYDSDSIFTLIEDILKNNYAITFRQLAGDYMGVLKSVRNSGEKHFLVHCTAENLELILRQAQQLGIMTQNYHYLITNLDMQNLDLSAYKYSGANIMGVQLVNTTSEVVTVVTNDLQALAIEKGSDIKITASKLTVKTALVFDAISFFFEAIMLQHVDLDLKPVHCNRATILKFWTANAAYTKNTYVNGLTGPITFDNNGTRNDIRINILTLNESGMLTVGYWNSSTGLKMKPQPIVKHKNDEEGILGNKTFIVVVCLIPPYVIFKENHEFLSETYHLEGFGIDIIRELSQMLNFSYTFIIQEDGANGNINSSTGEWNGIIREIIDGRADLGIADLTITEDREKVVDFTVPFMELGISILYKKPKPAPASLFTFSSPFSLRLWFWLGIAYAIVSVSLSLIGRLCHSEWVTPHPCIQNPEYHVNQFNLMNCFWFTTGSFMQQGSEIAPAAIPTRLVAGVWWFFTLIMVSSYTANLAAFLTVEKLAPPFKDIQELQKQGVIKYGAKADGATTNFFKNSDTPLYSKVWEYMESNPDAMSSSNKEGIERVENENYAFLMESTSIEYVEGRHCNLTRIGGLLDYKGYGIAIKKNSKYRYRFNTAILKLQETGRLIALRNKWWKEKYINANCTSRSHREQASSLDFNNITGVFLVLAIGTLVGFSESLVEFVVSRARH